MRAVALRGQYWHPSCSPSTPVQLLTSLQATVFSTTSIYADDTQLRLAMLADNTSAGLSVLAACTADVRQWYMQNGPAAQPGQIRSTDYRNGTPVTCCDINRVVRHCRRRQSAVSQGNEGAQSHPRSAPDFREARFSNCSIVQLPQPSHPPHSPSADDSTCTDACL